MKRNLHNRICSLAALLLFSMCSFAAGNRYEYSFNVQRPIDATSDEASACSVKIPLFKSLIGLSTPESATLKATWINSLGKESFYDTNTTGDKSLGHWFTKTGLATNKEKNYCIKVVWDAPVFQVSHNTAANVEVGQTYLVKEALIYKNDTIIYSFNVKIGEAGSASSVTTDQPAVSGRKGITDGWLVNPVVQKNDEEPQNHNWIQVNVGDKITLGCDIIDKKEYSSAKYSWIKYSWDKKNKKETTKSLRGYNSADFVLTESAEYEDGGRYEVTARLSKADGSSVVIRKYTFFVDVQSNAGQFYKWPTHTLAYDFKTEYPNLDKPTKIHSINKKTGGKAYCYSGDWWCVYWGDNLNSECGTDSATVKAAAKNLVEKYEEDFAYIRDSIGWPPDLSARKGYKSFVYIFGSGLSNDNESNTTQGGYQSSTYADGSNWACVWASYYPFSRFRTDKSYSDAEYQCNAMVHEGIHATFADLSACQGSSWFHEGGNTWLQGQVYARRDGVHGEAGFLDGGPFLAPHMPIECYSGWLQDGSYGGPAAQGVNMYVDGAQICTWRNYLGGVQYANAFPTVVANICGDKSIAWIWRYCKNRVLETMGDTLGDEAMRQIILQYRARQALFDLGGWDDSYRAVANSYFGTTIKPEYSNGHYENGKIVGKNSGSNLMSCWINVEPTVLTPYQSVELNDSHGWMAPDTLTNPGWSGGNVIPIHVDLAKTVANVEFRPEDTNMRAVLCYRTKEGECYYSQPVMCGNMSIDITNQPANGVIFCVVVNTDYIYTGDTQRKHHWDYRIRLQDGALGIADIHKKWYFYEQTITDNAFVTDIKEIKLGDVSTPSNDAVKIMTSNIRAGQPIQLRLDGVSPSQVMVRVVGLPGVVAAAGRLNPDGTFIMPANIPSGLYVLTFSYDGQRQVVKTIVK